MNVSENGILRKILGLKRDDLTLKLRELHGESFFDLYFLPKHSQVIK